MPDPLVATIEPAPQLSASVVPGGALAATTEAAQELAAELEATNALAPSLAAAQAIVAELLPAPALAATSSSQQLVPEMAAPAPPFYVAPEELQMPSPSRLFAADFAELSSGSGLNSWLDAQQQAGRLPQLGLSDHGWLEFVLTGHLEAPSSANTLEVQILLDNGAFGPVLALGPVSPFAGLANYVLRVELLVQHEPAAQPRQLLRAHLDAWLDDGTSLADLRARGVCAIAEGAAHELSLRVRKQLATAAHTLSVRSFSSLWHCCRSGS